jgi:hypothetical protein
MPELETAQHENTRPLMLHVKTALSVDDAQICVVPNIAWAALAEGRNVTVVFDGSAVKSIAKGYGWQGWIGSDSTAMDRASLPERERQSLAEQFAVVVDTVPNTYGDYLGFLRERGTKLFYNQTMAVLYQIEPKQIDENVSPLAIKDLVKVLTAPGDYLVY